MPPDNTCEVVLCQGALSRPEGELAVDQVLEYAEANLNLVTEMFNNCIKQIETTTERLSQILSRRTLTCGLCNSQFDYTSCNTEEQPLLAFCYHNECTFVSHLKCLRDHMLNHKHNSLIPTVGDCVDCGNLLKWTQLVKYSLKLKALAQISDT